MLKVLKYWSAYRVIISLVRLGKVARGKPSAARELCTGELLRPICGGKIPGCLSNSCCMNQLVPLSAICDKSAAASTPLVQSSVDTAGQRSTLCTAARCSLPSGARTPRRSDASWSIGERPLPKDGVTDPSWVKAGVLAFPQVNSNSRSSLSSVRCRA